MATTSKSTMKDCYLDCLTQQIEEFELLKSMYPNQGEIVCSDKDIIKDIRDFLDNKTEYIPSHLDFKLNLFIDGLKLEVFINLPSSYPKEEPDIYVRCNKMNRQNESSLNSELMNYIKENHIGEVCLYTAISWLQENVDKFSIITQESPADTNNVSNETKNEFVRFWIYSHHIYNKRKREEIVKKARELKLTGFSLPGKPGIICIEGHHDDCKEWWKDIKSMTWKKIMIRKTEIFEPCEERSYRKFSNFEELCLKNPVHNKHSNMSELSKLMNELGLNQVFNELFGLCNDE
ncbi:RWD domain-containing protein 2B [Helicoverpa armigera]|uniref:RWD domain-containing protein 2B n=1 Tax=Helicoverpa armigera TaxID=29058 RepID=UPI003082A8C4